MAQENSTAPSKAPWTKIFTAFKVALDMKKMSLAAAGIFCAFVGWWALSWTFYGLRTMPPDILESKEIRDQKDPAVIKAEWDAFKARRESWNLIHELAGTFDEAIRIDAADVTNDFNEYVVLKSWQGFLKRQAEKIQIQDNALVITNLNNAKFLLTAADENTKSRLKDLHTKELTLRAIKIPQNEKAPRAIEIDGVILEVDGPSFEKLKEYLQGAVDLAVIEGMAQRAGQMKTFEKFRAQLANPRPKVAGLLRVSPWHENRGGNPYLIVADAVKTRGESLVGNGQLASWFIKDEAPVLWEPLVKFLLPIVYMFDARAGGWDRLYLILIIFWTLLIWGYFGGAICRIAAVQVARNERITLRDAITFANERCISYIAAPAFPMVLLAILTFLLMIFGWIVWIPWLGEIVAGLLWPIVICIGFVMAIVLVGLVGWPIMTATISTEGTDSFDALSRSYSYIYQAPWQFLWYNLLAVCYGAVVVFFIGFMASMLVFFGKWGVSTAVGLSSADPKTDREPSYLFVYAPTSFGWRDLFISSNTRYVEEKTVTSYDGRQVKRLEFKDEYEKEITGFNKFGAVLVSVWVYPFFLLVVGFGYSYFWSASTIIYFLMRRHVDDTEMDEVHMEEDNLDDPFLRAPPPAPAAAPPPAPESKPGTVSLNLVEAPPPSPPTYAAPEPPANPPPN